MIATRKGPPTRLVGHTVSAGRPWPLGASVEADGVNFAVFSAHATGMELCLFSEDGKRELARVAMRERDGDIWHVNVGGLMPGARYGFRAHGPYDPENGHRFNPNKLLIDPYAKALDGRLKWSDALMAYRVGSPRADLSFDTRDSAFAVPKSVVVDPAFSWGEDHPPRRPWHETVIYEAHVKGLTQKHPDVPPGLRGSYLGVCSDAMIEHLLKLGVTAVELLPVHAFVDDRFLVSRGLRNYWGYQTIGFFAPEPRYMTRDALWEFRAMVRRLHAAGLEVILDVVYNHTAEGDQMGPTLSFRGLDNRSYYRLQGSGRYYINDTGTGNTLDVANPIVLRMVLDSLRWWAEVCHVDGFRFDLASVLGREPHGFDQRGGFFDAIRQDPVLTRVKLIAEPWDIGPGGYQLGGYPHPFREWNDRYRDEMRRFWRGDAGLPELAKRLLGSAEQFDHNARGATSSVNFLTAHDGFTLHDVVSYTEKRNHDNGEDNRDGHSDNHSDNLGVEGPTDDPGVNAARALRKRNMLATLLLSQGVPMLLAGDEIGNSQGGNNNAYAQDNEISWLDWAQADTGLTAFVARLTALRKALPALRQRSFLHGDARPSDGLRDVIWRLPDGREPQGGDWHTANRCLGLELRGDAQAADDIGPPVFVVVNPGDAQRLTLPDTAPGWRLLLDTTRPEAPEEPAVSGEVDLPGGAVLVFCAEASAAETDAAPGEEHGT